MRQSAAIAFLFTLVAWLSAGEPIQKSGTIKKIDFKNNVLYFTDAELCPYLPTVAPWLKAPDEA